MAPTTTRTKKLRPAQRDRLTDQAHSAIRAAILAGDFSLGERLVETRLASELQMSRAPVREALQRLLKEGLVTEHPHQGTFVTDMTATDVVEFYNVRLGLETTALRLFMDRGASTDPLWGKIAAMERAAERNDMSGVVSAEFEFHRHICQATGNALLNRLFGEQEGRLMLVISLDDASFEQLGDVAAEHQPVVEAIETGDQAAAVLAMEEHLLSTVGELLERLGGDPEQLLAPLDVARARRNRRKPLAAPARKKK